MLGPRLKSAIADSKNVLGPAELNVRAQNLKSKIGTILEDIAIRARRQQKTRDDDLEIPILRALQRFCERRISTAPPPQADGSSQPGSPASRSILTDL